MDRKPYEAWDEIEKERNRGLEFKGTFFKISFKKIKKFIRRYVKSK